VWRSRHQGEGACKSEILTNLRAQFVVNYLLNKIAACTKKIVNWCFFHSNQLQAIVSEVPDGTHCCVKSYELPQETWSLVWLCLQSVTTCGSWRMW
jgi:hypothetical protein